MRGFVFSSQIAAMIPHPCCSAAEFSNMLLDDKWIFEEEKLICATEPCEWTVYDTYDLLGEDSEDQLNPKKIVRRNCKLSGCDSECVKRHDNPEFFDSSIDGMLLFGFDEIFDQNDTTDDLNIKPYTPDYDHCYSQPIHMQQLLPEDEVKKEPESDSPSDTSDDDIDVVTIPEHDGKPFLPRYTKQQQQRVVQPRKYVRRRNARKNAVCTVKAAASMFKRTRYQPRQSVKRRKINSVETSPYSSPSSSCYNSRQNSDVEDLEKRNVHNILERKRREAQTIALNALRRTLPELDDKKSPKVLVLKTATEEVNKLKAIFNKNQNRIAYERQRRAKLLARLQQLQNELK